MIRSGMLSISFRKLGAREIVDLVAKNGLEGIEWGGDVHVPHGDLGLAREVGKMTRDAGLAVAAYGSYYRLVESPQQGLEFGKVLDSACELGAPLIRVWAGQVPDSLSATEDDWTRVIEEARRLGDLAAERGVTLSFEYHGGTLNDRLASSRRLLRAINRRNVNTLWQPTLAVPVEYNIQSLVAALPDITNVHTFYWVNGAERRMLAEGEESWKAYFAVLRQSGRDHYALLEFIKDDSVENLAQDAATLKKILAAG